MALLVPSPEIFLLAGRDSIQRTRSKNLRFISVCSGVKDMEKVVLKLSEANCEDGARLMYGQVKESETTPFSSKKGKVEEEKKLDYYVNTGYAIRTLRKELPELFYRELNFDIYRFKFIYISLQIFFCMLDLFYKID